MFRYLPVQGSTVAPEVDWIHNFITDVSVACTVLICGAMLYFAIKYRKRNGVDHETPQITGSHFLEFVWTAFPTIISIFVAYEGVRVYYNMREVPQNAMTINAIASQWKWEFEYDTASGKKTLNEFVVPVGEPVKVVLTSRDVLHSFFIPAMRVKKDAISGQYTYVSFTPVQAGEYPVYCTEYCGREHSYMLAKLRVVPKAEFTRWVNDTSKRAQKEQSPVERGKTAYLEKGCKSCHSLDGSRLVGPSFQKLWERNESLSDGSTVKVDENYLRESILYPTKKIVASYGPLMPAYEGQLTEDEISGLIAFIKTQDGSTVPSAAPAASAVAAVDESKLSPAEKGKRIYETKLCVTCHSLDGSRVVGPSFKGIYGREQVMADGSKVVSNDDYIKQSILQPSAKVVQGYPPAMPPYEGQLSDDDIKHVIEFLKTVK